MMATGTAEYVFDNENDHARSQHDALAKLLDPFTFERLETTGVTDGWRCLEIGAGGGSVATWLAAKVAPAGDVLATDVKPDLIPHTPGLEVRRHDVVSDPLPETAFDLIHARLVLSHLPQREAVLAKLVTALRPGGRLQIDEIDIRYWPVLLAPDAQAREAYERYLAGMDRLLRAAGSDPTWGARVAQSMVDAGLEEIDPALRQEVWKHGSAGLDLLVSNSHHLRDRFVEAGVSDGQLAELRRVVSDPSFKAVSFTVHSVIGRRPL